MFIFPTILADFKDPIQKSERVWSELHKAYAPLFFSFDIIPEKAYHYDPHRKNILEFLGMVTDPESKKRS